MKHLLHAMAAIVMMGALSCTSLKPTETKTQPSLVTQVPLEYLNESNKSDYVKRLKAADVDVVLVSLEDVFQTGAERDSLMACLKDAIDYFGKAGFEVGVWTNSLGYGAPRPVLDSLCPGLRLLTDFTGRTADAVCTTDPVFREICCGIVRDFAKAGARFILMDDDLVQSVRPGFTCVCEGHLDLLEKKTGKRFTREQVRDLFTGNPSKERTDFMDVMGASLMDFCKSLRDAADEVNPEIVMGICSSFTHFDAEGVDMMELSNLLAGKGHKPFLRISGSPYWPIVAPRFIGQTLGDVTDFARMQIGWYRDRDIVLFDENDPYPRKSDVVPASFCELYDKVMIANGGINRHKYMFCYDPKEPDYAYLDAHLSSMKDDSALERMFSEKTPVGYRVWEPEHRLRGMALPEDYCGSNWMMVAASQSPAAAFLTANGVAARFEGGPESGTPHACPGIAFGAQAALLPDEAIHGGLILDVPAALALQARGIDVGLASCELLPQVPEYESFGTASRPFGMAPEGDGGTKEAVSGSYDGNGASDYKPMFCGGYYRIAAREDVDSRAMSIFIGKDGERSPSCLACKTDDGAFVIYAWDAQNMLFANKRPWACTERQEQLRFLFRAMAGESSLLASPVCRDGLYLLPSQSEDGSHVSILICNMTSVDMHDATIQLVNGLGDMRNPVQASMGWKICGQLRSQATIADGTLCVSCISAMDWCAVELARDGE